ncbi:hypothetical protein DSO57_1000331 [Entomophthora muscae]|uniref:Uncharacterized protein n=1 Tax=Entomophthora muscae TaxID=34485 RepID=A0ACC2TKH1_9FUNG|nr:hypothetical protein DSO57_1000331 [Entomophthora muscae]
MLFLVLKCVVFSPAPVLLFTWLTSPNLWEHIFSSAYHVGGDSTRLMYLFNNFPGRANVLLSTGKTLVKILTCDDIDLYFLGLDPMEFPAVETTVVFHVTDREDAYPSGATYSPRVHNYSLSLATCRPGID